MGNLCLGKTVVHLGSNSLRFFASRRDFWSERSGLKRALENVIVSTLLLWAPASEISTQLEPTSQVRPNHLIHCRPQMETPEEQQAGVLPTSSPVNRQTRSSLPTTTRQLASGARRSSSPLAVSNRQATHSVGQELGGIQQTATEQVGRTIKNVTAQNGK